MRVFGGDQRRTMAYGTMNAMVLEKHTSLGRRAITGKSAPHVLRKSVWNVDEAP